MPPQKWRRGVGVGDHTLFSVQTDREDTAVIRQGNLATPCLASVQQNYGHQSRPLTAGTDSVRPAQSRVGLVGSRPAAGPVARRGAAPRRRRTGIIPAARRRVIPAAHWRVVSAPHGRARQTAAATRRTVPAERNVNNSLGLLLHLGHECLQPNSNDQVALLPWQPTRRTKPNLLPLWRIHKDATRSIRNKNARASSLH